MALTDAPGLDIGLVAQALLELALHPLPLQHQPAQAKFMPGCLRPGAFASYVPRVRSALENVHLVLFAQLWGYLLAVSRIT